MRRPATPAMQKGNYLLESLVAILLTAFGILGLVGVHASAIRASNEARFRAEAGNIASGMIAEMWTETAARMDADFCSGCAKLASWQNKARSLLPSANVAVDLAVPGLSAESRSVTVNVSWRLAGSTERHDFVSTAQIGKNR
jgi:type IV pilus assembly protein PilV